jgi:hypothetical protein
MNEESIEILKKLKETFYVELERTNISDDDKVSIKSLIEKKKELEGQIVGINRELDGYKHRLSEQYIFNCEDIGRGNNCIIVKFRTPTIGFEESSVYEEMKKKFKEQNPYRNIHFNNLNDLNSAKFLSDEEKRQILGLSGKKGE